MSLSLSLCSHVVGGQLQAERPQSMRTVTNHSGHTNVYTKQDQKGKKTNSLLNHKNTDLTSTTPQHATHYPPLPSLTPVVIPEACSCWWVWSRCWAAPLRPAACSSCWGRGCRWPGPNPAGSRSAAYPRGNLVCQKTEMVKTSTENKPGTKGGEVYVCSLYTCILCNMIKVTA